MNRRNISVSSAFHIPDGSVMKTVSAGMLDFVRTKVKAWLVNTGEGISRNELNAGHARIWAQEFLSICDELRRLDSAGESRKLNGIDMHESPPPHSTAEIEDALRTVFSSKNSSEDGV